MKHIFVIFTGGTIGTMIKEDGFLGDVTAPYRLLKDFANNYPEIKKDVMFFAEEPLCQLSENMTIPDWNKLIRFLQSVDFPAYDGVIITHGTDTLALTANLLSVLLEKPVCPVCLVSSDLPLEDKDATGHVNFKQAVDWIVNGKEAGVFVPVSDKKKGHWEKAVLAGNRIRQSVGLDDLFREADRGPEALVNVIEEAAFGNLLYRVDELSSCVAWIRGYVGQLFDDLVIPDRIKAVLYETFHSFTVCTKMGPGSLLTLVQQAKNRPVYLAPFGEEGRHQYESMKGLPGQVRGMINTTPEQAYARILVKYAMKNP